MDWYDIIEEPIRPFVRYLRDNGINTVCSCGHDMTIQAELVMDGELQRIHKLLACYFYEHELEVNYIIDFHLEVYNGHPHHFIVIKFP